MPEETKNQAQSKRRTEIKDLSQPEQELSAEEQKEVKGGLNSTKSSTGVVVNHEEQYAFGDGSVRTGSSSITDGTSNTILKP